MSNYENGSLKTNGGAPQSARAAIRAPGAARPTNDWHFFLIVLETDKSKTTGPADSASDESRLLTVSSQGRGMRALWGLF